MNYCLLEGVLSKIYEGGGECCNQNLQDFRIPINHYLK